MTLVRRSAALVALLAGIFVPATAAAFPAGSQFDDDALTADGAGGIPFTGSPRLAGHACDACHTTPQKRIAVRLEADEPGLFDGGYQPGRVYLMQAVLTGEHAGLAFRDNGDECGNATETPFKACNDNGVAVEFADGGGKPVGTLAAPGASGRCGDAPPTDPEVRVLQDGSAVTHSGLHHARDAWRFCWTAPGRGTGPITVYVAAVDGNGGDGTVDNPSDTTGDDVFVGHLPMPEQGGDGLGYQVGSCAMAAGRAGAGASGGGTDGSGNGARGDGATGLVAGLLVALVVVRRRRHGRGAGTDAAREPRAPAAARRRRRARGATLAVLLLAACATQGCATVRPWEKEKHAKRIMRFAPDRAEDELDLHMLEAREGSTGGYGSAGGGCGCN